MRERDLTIGAMHRVHPMRELRQRWTLIYDGRRNSFPIDFFGFVVSVLYTIYIRRDIRSVIIIKKIANNCRCRCWRPVCLSIERSCCLQREAVGHLTASLHHQLPPLKTWRLLNKIQVLYKIIYKLLWRFFTIGHNSLMSERKSERWKLFCSKKLFFSFDRLMRIS